MINLFSFISRYQIYLHDSRAQQPAIMKNIIANNITSILILDVVDDDI